MANVVLQVQDKLRVAAERHGKAPTKEPASGEFGHAAIRRQVNEYEKASGLQHAACVDDTGPRPDWAALLAASGQKASRLDAAFLCTIFADCAL